MQQLNKKRQRATPEQLQVLEEAFGVNPSPNAKMREMIADSIKMTERSVQIWFQNRYGLDKWEIIVVVPRLSRCNVRKLEMMERLFIMP
jgi:Homeodomain